MNFNANGIGHRFCDPGTRLSLKHIAARPPRQSSLALKLRKRSIAHADHRFNFFPMRTGFGGHAEVS
jgi:hypothetical protein